MITLFGKYVRKLRIEHDERLFDMAQKIGVSSAYLSAAENGKRNVPQEWEKRITVLYKLNPIEQSDLEETIIRTNQNINLSLTKNMSEAKKELAISFARELDELTEEDINKILKVLGKKVN